MQPPKKKSGKVMLEKGYSQLDWLRLQKSEKNLAGMIYSPSASLPPIRSASVLIVAHRSFGLQQMADMMSSRIQSWFDL